MKCLKLLLIICLIHGLSNSLLAQKGSSGGHAAGVHPAAHGGGAVYGVVGSHSSGSYCELETKLDSVDFQKMTIKFYNRDSLETTGMFSAIVKKEGRKNVAETVVLLKNRTGDAYQFYSFEDIESVSVTQHFHELPVSPGFEYRKFDNTNRVWRKIADNKAKVYDDLLFSNEKAGKIGSHFKIVCKEKTFDLNGDEGLRSLRGKFKNFINKRYSKNFKKKDFTSTLDMIKYIADNG